MKLSADVERCCGATGSSFPIDKADKGTLIAGLAARASWLIFCRNRCFRSDSDEELTLFRQLHFLLSRLEDVETELVLNASICFRKFAGCGVQLLCGSRIVQFIRNGDGNSFQFDWNGFGYSQLLHVSNTHHKPLRGTALLSNRRSEPDTESVNEFRCSWISCPGHISVGPNEDGFRSGHRPDYRKLPNLRALCID